MRGISDAQGLEEAVQRAIDHLQATGERDGELLDGLMAIVHECQYGRIVVLEKSSAEVGYGPTTVSGDMLAEGLADCIAGTDPYRDAGVQEELGMLLRMLRG